MSERPNQLAGLAVTMVGLVGWWTAWWLAWPWIEENSPRPSTKLGIIAVASGQWTLLGVGMIGSPFLGMWVAGPRSPRRPSDPPKIG